MAEGPVYAILGRGRWARRMQSLLTGEKRRFVEITETRQGSWETNAAYRERLAEKMRASGAQMAWACVLPGPHVPLMVDAALDAELHIICEKPWWGSRSVAESLIARAKSLRRVVAMHYEYCFLSEVERWRKEFSSIPGLEFGGSFFLSRPNHTGMSALDNLGSHLLAIREYATRRAVLGEIRCGYEQADERSAWLRKNGQPVAFLNLLEQKELIIQRFLAAVEASLDNGIFPVDLEFGVRVAEQLAPLAANSRSGGV
jgi:hypothetical protein